MATNLVLSRKKNEAVRVDGPAKVIVKSIKGNTVTLVFVAEKSVRIMRAELEKAA